METTHSLQRRCYDNVCHCDWRLTIYDCVESHPARIIYIINIVISAFASIIGIGLTFHRVAIKGHSFIDLSSRKGFLKPKPIDSMLLSLTIFNILRLINSIVLVVDIAPDNLIFRSFLFEIAWQFGYGAFALYLIGISQTLAESHKSISNNWLPPPRVVDAVGLTFLLAPIIVNNPLSISAGVLATTDVNAAEICTRALYFSWFINCSGLSCTVIYCGSRLAKMLERHLKKYNTTSQRYNNVKNGVFKVRAVMVLITLCCLMFACFLLLYGILRTMIMKNSLGSVVLCAIWTTIGTATMILVEAVIVFNPNVGKESNRIVLKSSDEEQSSNIFGTQNTMKGKNDMTFEGSLTNGALDDLELKYDHALKNQHGSKILKSNLRGNSRYFYAKKPDEFHIGESEESTNGSTLIEKSTEPNILIKNTKDSDCT